MADRNSLDLSDSATRHSHDSTAMRLVQIADLLVTSGLLGLHLVTAAMLVAASSSDEEVRHG